MKDTGWPLMGVAALLALALHAVVFALGLSPVSLGRLVDGDCYMRLVRVLELFQHGRWYDQEVTRSNAPYGTRLPWTRGMDVLLLAGAWAGTLFADFRTSLFWFGAISAPLLQAAAAALIAWGSAPLLESGWRIAAVALFLAQAGTYSFFKLGRPDHHALQVVLMLAVVAVLVRCATRKDAMRGPAVAGVLAALALWVSAEALLVVLVGGVALGLLWLRDGAPRGRGLAAYAAGFMTATFLFLLVERHPSDWLTVEYDRIAITHVVLGLGMLAAADIVRRAEARGLLASAAGRAAAAAVLVGLLAAAIAVVFPGFFAGPFGNLTDDVKRLLMDDSREVRSLVPGTLVQAGTFFFLLGPLLVALPYAAWAAARGPRERRDGHLVLLVGMILFFAMALRYARVAPFAEALAVVPWAAALAAAVHGWPAAAGKAGRLALFAAMLGGPTMLGTLLATAGGHAHAPRNPCPWDRLAAHLDAARPAIDRPIVLTLMYAGPELLWRTPYDVVSAPFYDDRDGMMDTYNILGAAGEAADAAARTIVERRGVGLVVVCNGGGPAVTGTWGALRAPDALYERLRAGRPPAWLEPVPLPEDLAMFRLYTPRP